MDAMAALKQIDDLTRHAESAIRDKDGSLVALYVGLIAGVTTVMLAGGTSKPEPSLEQWRAVRNFC